MRLLPVIVAIALILSGGALSGWPRSFAAELPWLDPNWLQAHVGEDAAAAKCKATFVAQICTMRRVIATIGAAEASAYFNPVERALVRPWEKNT